MIEFLEEAFFFAIILPLALVILAGALFCWGIGISLAVAWAFGL